MRLRPLLLLAAALALLLPATTVEPATAIEQPPAVQPPLPLPTSMVALGDSITTGYNACGKFRDCPDQSWSTGTDDEVNSHYRRLLAISPAIEGRVSNLAESGAKMEDLVGQARAAVERQPDYVTILIGANDACTSSENDMTPVPEFRGQLDEAMAVLATGLPRTRVVVASIPDLHRLWEVEHRDRLAQLVWWVGSICQSMLDDARSVDAGDVARRERVRQRVVDYNAQLRDACAAFGRHCRFDGNAVFDHRFEAGDVSSWDAFHPDVSGQALIAELTSRDGFAW